MRKVFFLLLLIQFLTAGCYAQNFLLLDRKWSRDAIVVDTVTRQNLSDGWYPIYRESLDTLIILVGRLKDLKNDGLSRKFYYSDDFNAPHLKFNIENIKRTYGDGYEINLVSFGTFGDATVKLSDSRELLDVNQKTIRSFLSYLKTTQKRLANNKIK